MSSFYVSVLDSQLCNCAEPVNVPGGWAIDTTAAGTVQFRFISLVFSIEGQKAQHKFMFLWSLPSNFVLVNSFYIHSPFKVHILQEKKLL